MKREMGKNNMLIIFLIFIYVMVGAMFAGAAADAYSCDIDMGKKALAFGLFWPIMLVILLIKVILIAVSGLLIILKDAFDIDIKEKRNGE